MKPYSISDDETDSGALAASDGDPVQSIAGADARGEQSKPRDRDEIPRPETFETTQRDMKTVSCCEHEKKRAMEVEIEGRQGASKTIKLLSFFRYHHYGKHGHSLACVE